ncbi:unnamed protein product [Chrysodeixis includens]|uniref:ZAD domain-containing protein n=1 Tax=Chrysodeixis includens TaxID=689277 RepID=A0A9N8Q181_CHRIL|nr:unnamed protein product [Chrysodeixis includens]
MNDETEQIFLLNTGQGPSVTLAEKMVGGQLPGTAHTSLENVDDFSNVCRTCATVTEFVIPIFAGEGLQNNLAEKIHKHLPIKVSETDVLPRVVCYQCASTLLAWHELVQCCVQADAALQARVQESKCAVTKPNPTLTEDAENNHVRNVLHNNFLNDLDGDDLDVEFVCQKCVDKPSLGTVRDLAQHLQHCHADDVRGDGAVLAYITNYVTFEQMLVEDSDRETSSDKKEKARAVLPTLLCPFCADVFSSPTRLVYHLNQHVDVSIEDGVVCCDLLYSDKRSFARHLQAAHVHRADDARRKPQASRLTTTGHDKNRYASELSEDERPLATLATKKPATNNVYTNFYRALLNFRDHFVNDEHSSDEYPDFTDSSASEVEVDNEENFDDLLALVPVTRAVSRARSCPFCGVTPPHAEFRKHVVVEHSHLLFHCEECSGYVDRKNFLVHMAQHAALYAAPHAKQELLALEAPRRRKHKKLKEENDVKQSQNTSGLAPLAKIERETPVQELDNSEKKQTNEFSDHSDTEDGFGPLPDTCFNGVTWS